MRNIVFTEFSRILKDFEQAVRGATGCILLQAMVHLDDFGVKTGSGIEDPGRLLGKVKEQVDPGGEIARPDHGDFRGCFFDGFAVIRIVSGGPDHGLAVFARQFGKRTGGIAKGKNQSPSHSPRSIRPGRLPGRPGG